MTHQGAVPHLDDDFSTMRNRAYDLADTGRYKDWSHVGYVLLAERFSPALIKRLDADRLAVLMISRICKSRRRTIPSWRARVRCWFADVVDRWT